jgi:hypothetical protein
MRASKTNLSKNEIAKAAQDENQNGIENYEVATVHPAKGARYRFPYNSGIFSFAAKRSNTAQRIDNFENSPDWDQASANPSEAYQES